PAPASPADRRPARDPHQPEPAHRRGSVPSEGSRLMLHDYLKASDKIALVCGGQRLSYREIDERSNALANSLVAGGVERGDRVIVFADNTVETVIAFWAVLKANAVVSIVNPLTKADKLAYLLNDCRAVALVTDGHLTPVFAEAPRRSGSRAVEGAPRRRRLVRRARRARRDPAAGAKEHRRGPRRDHLHLGQH